MNEETMPTAEAMPEAAHDDERAHYELAFHVLPTVVEGEVPAIMDAIKKIVTDAGGELTDEEAPERFDLAYEIVKHLEGKNRAFKSAYFGWIRFKVAAGTVPAIGHALELRTDILRHMLIRLSREEEQHPFRFHEALVSQKKVAYVGEEDIVDTDGSTDEEVIVEESDDSLDEDASKKDEA